MNTETELKYSAAPGIFTNRILCSDMINSYVIENSHGILNMKAVYYDDAYRTLAQNRIGYRVRKENTEYIATVKYPANADKSQNSVCGSVDGLSRRSEYNLRVNNEHANPRVFAEIIPDHWVTAILCSISLIPLFTTEFQRELIQIQYRQSVIEVSYDHGLIYSNVHPHNSETGRSSLPISELECELKSGYEADLLEFGELIAAEFNLSPMNVSKLKRGLSLITD